jgi:hypothetical protein
MGVASAPAVSGGFTLGVGLRYGWLSLAAEGRVDLPASTEVIGGGRVSSALYLGALLPCLHLGPFSGCAVVKAGALRGEGHDLPLADAVTLPYLAAGARLAGELSLFRPLSIRIYGDFTGALARAVLRDTMTQEVLWRMPPVSGAFGLAIVANLL